MKIPIHNHPVLGIPNGRTAGCPACDQWFGSLDLMMAEVFDALYGDEDGD